MNKTILTGLIIWLLPIPNFAQASYGAIESRFTKNQLTKNDSMAFQRSAEEKLNQLLAYSKLYSDTNTGSNTKAIVAKKAQAMFRTNTQTGNVEVVQFDSLLIKLSIVIDSSQSDIETSMKWIKKKESFGQFKSTNKKFQLDVILIKAPKSFGRNEEEIWQVYFCRPVFK